MNGKQHLVVAHTVIVALALILIFVPEFRAEPVLKWPFVVLLLVVMAYDIWEAYRSGNLTVPMSELHRRRPHMGADQFLASICGTIAFFLVL